MLWLLLAKNTLFSLDRAEGEKSAQSERTGTGDYNILSEADIDKQFKAAVALYSRNHRSVFALIMSYLYHGIFSVDQLKFLTTVSLEETRKLRLKLSAIWNVIEDKATEALKTHAYRLLSEIDTVHKARTDSNKLDTLDALGAIINLGAITYEAKLDMTPCAIVDFRETLPQTEGQVGVAPSAPEEVVPSTARDAFMQCEGLSSLSDKVQDSRYDPNEPGLNVAPQSLASEPVKVGAGEQPVSDEVLRSIGQCSKGAGLFSKSAREQVLKVEALPTASRSLEGESKHDNSHHRRNVRMA